MLKYTDLLGAKWNKDGNSLLNGFNCYNLCKELYNRIGIEVPEQKDITYDAARIDSEIEERSKYFKQVNHPKFGVLVTFTIKRPYTSHVGFMLDNDRFIHILPKSKVTVEKLSHVLWKNRITGYYEPITNNFS